jgi:hypothetical protein
MLAQVSHILPITQIRRERMLPVPGKVLVRTGQKLSAGDVIVEANVFPEVFLIDVARGLGMPAERVEKYIRVEAGDSLAEKDVIAGPVGLTRKLMRTPREGKVILSAEGQILIEATTKPMQLKAGFPGEVVELLGDRGATIEATGALVQGVWGNGRTEYGVIKAEPQTPNQGLTAAQLTVDLRGAILLAGYCCKAEVLQAAATLPLRGLVLGGLDPELVPAALKLSIPVLVLEGFGKRPINSVAFKLLSTNERRDVAVIAERWDRLSGQRPELIIPLPAPGNVTVPQEMAHFEPGQQVRVLRAPFVSETGVIVSLKGVETLASGVRTQAAEVRLESGSVVRFPLVNLEVLV